MEQKSMARRSHLSSMCSCALIASLSRQIRRIFPSPDNSYRQTFDEFLKRPEGSAGHSRNRLLGESFVLGFPRAGSSPRVRKVTMRTETVGTADLEAGIRINSAQLL
jgi:hypothetical protein